DAEGGFYDSGPFNQRADRRSKIWWVQTEAIVSALYMNRITGDSKYLEVFEETSNFIEQNMVDWSSGEWHAEITPDGTARGDKANAWKAGYHNGRSMIECLEILKQWKD
ncbi:MAG: AGE family epimerase/isomerase, partial [Planctomycetota bacterium]